ncbi:MAG: TonB-dependent receptor [Thermoanaerobaculaceae bacterium]|nr:TonB-dependent receptor [Thermoanaerobaculaceae bacterium]
MLKRFLIVLCALAIAIPALAQNPTGTLTGRAADDKGEALPGVTVTVSSPNLQGTRTAVTSINGDYIFRFLPPGEYTVKFELQGFSTLDTSVKISAAQTSAVNAEMPMSQVTEEVTVTGSYETISTSAQVATTYEQSLIEALPMARTMTAAAAMTPGVSATGPSNYLTISGAMSYENLYLVNGVSVQDNVRNTPNTLWIEDAIQETTTSTANVSAEYGRFAGGVVNTLTKSGGNDFSGSLRLSLDNDKWQEKTPKTVYGSQVDKINQTWEATLGGFILKDRIWFFGAYRSRETETSSQTYNTGLVFNSVRDQERYEAKLTFAVTPNHRFIGSYMNVEDSQTNYVFGTVLDMASVDPYRETPQDLLAVNYNGVLSDNFFVEGQYSSRHFTFIDSGSPYTDIIKGTVIRDNVHYWNSNSAYFCGACDDKTRDNEDILVKGSWFMSTQNMGTHDVVFGFDQFKDKSRENNYQSGSNWIYWPTQYLSQITGGAEQILLDPVLHQPVPIVYGDGSSDFTFWAMLDESQGTNFVTNSLFINDRWRLTNNLSFNIGVRYDQNDGEDASGNKVTDDSRFSPRLGVSWDIKGDGDWVVNAGYAQYVMAIASNVADEGGGNPSSFGYLYEGPDINADCTPNTIGSCLNAHQVLDQVFAWLFANGTDAYGRPLGRDVVYGSIAGLSQIIGDNLKSPMTEEMTIGVTKRLGSNGLVRFDYIHREANDLYATRVDMTTGQVEDELGNVSDLKIVGTSDFLERFYEGFNLQASYRISDRISLGGNYTWSHAYGNYEGESSGSGPFSNTSNPDYYPEYTRQEWTNPKGDLSIDQRHRGRLYLVWDAISTKHNKLSVSLMESYFSGTPYDAQGSIYSYPYVTNPGYAQRPVTVNYFFTKRAAYRTEDITRTDLGINYAFRLPAFGREIEFFIQPEVTNLFNEQGVVAVNTTVKTRYNGSSWLLFNPFTTAPKECPQSYTSAECKAGGFNWQKGPDFGKPTGTTSYQTPRTYTVSFGVRF